MRTAHTLLRHGNCEEFHCPICDGGLEVCSVCGGAEGALPTECPGTRMNADLQDRVYAGLADFKDGKWICPTTQDN